MAETERSAGEQRKMPKKAHLEPNGLHRPENMYWMNIGICIMVLPTLLCTFLAAWNSLLCLISDSLMPSLLLGDTTSQSYVEFGVCTVRDSLKKGWGIIMGRSEKVECADCLNASMGWPTI